MSKEIDKSGSFLDFQNLCKKLGAEPSYTLKTQIIADFTKTFKGDLYILCKFLMSRDDKRVFNIREKQFTKFLGREFGIELKELLEDLEKGDPGETARKYYQATGKAKSTSTLTLLEVDQFMERLTQVTKEDEQFAVISPMIKRCTPEDLKYLWKLIDHDLKVNIGPKFVLGALHPKAFDAYKNSHDLKLIIDRILSHTLDKKLKEEKKPKKKEKSEEDEDEDEKDGKRADSFVSGMSLMTPIKPMLARAIKSPEEGIKRCPNGCYTEIKYDGERIQIHKQGTEFKCFSRNLKAILPWKVEAVMEYIPKATKAKNIVLDGEILLMNTKTHQPLPFGTLAIHKKNSFQDATVCVFLFDILYLGEESLLHEPIWKRRLILEKNVEIIPNRIELSELNKIDKVEDLSKLMGKVIKAGQEGLVIKDKNSIYEPNARHWLKLKRDYIHGMADSADLYVLGAYFGTGNKGGLMTTFLMGCYDPESKQYKTVTKVYGGIDDDTLNKLQKELDVVKIFKDPERVPKWLDIHRSMIPDFVIRNPKKAPIWEIEGAEFVTISKVHSAANISIRFPRITKFRPDKKWEDATSFEDLKRLAYKNSEDVEASDNSKQTSESLNKSGLDDEEVEGISEKEVETSSKSNTKGKPKSKSNKMELKEESEEEMEAVDLIRMGGDVTSPIGPSPVKIIVNCTDNSGRWPKKGLFAAISKKWKQPEQEFVSSTLTQGEVQFVKCQEEKQTTIYVANIVVLSSQSHEIKDQVFELALNQIRKFAKKNNASVHFPNLSKDELIIKLLTSKGVPVFIYSFKSNNHVQKQQNQSSSRMEVEEKSQTKNVVTNKNQEMGEHLKNVNKFQKPKQGLQTNEQSSEMEIEMEIDNQKEKQKSMQKQEIQKQNNEDKEKNQTKMEGFISQKPKEEGTKKRSIEEAKFQEEIVPPKKQKINQMDEELPLLDAESKFPIFDDMNFVLDSTPNYSILQQKIEALGGYIQTEWIPHGSQSSTALIASSSSPLCLHVERLGGSILKEEWVHVCYQENQIVKKKEFFYKSNHSYDPTSKPPPLTLPSFFSNRAFLFCGTAHENILKRYIIAYDGEVVDEIEKATHAITDSKTWTPEMDKMLQKNQKIKIVSSDWVWDVIKTKKPHNDKPYFLKKKTN